MVIWNFSWVSVLSLQYFQSPKLFPYLLANCHLNLSKPAGLCWNDFDLDFEISIFDLLADNQLCFDLLTRIRELILLFCFRIRSLILFWILNCCWSLWIGILNFSWLWLLHARHRFDDLFQWISGPCSSLLSLVLLGRAMEAGLEFARLSLGLSCLPRWSPVLGYYPMCMWLPTLSTLPLVVCGCPLSWWWFSGYTSDFFCWAIEKGFEANLS